MFGQTEGVPPTFLTAAEFSVLPRVVSDPALGLDFSRVLHGGQSYELVRPLREGETLTVRARIDSVRIRAGTGFLMIVMDLVDEGGGEVAHSALDDDRTGRRVRRPVGEVSSRRTSCPSCAAW